MKQALTKALSSYETSILKNTKGSIADALVEDKRTRAVMNSMLGCKINYITDDGTEVFSTIEEVLIARAISAELKYPRGLDTIKRLAEIRGENEETAKINVSVSKSHVDEELAKRALD